MYENCNCLKSHDLTLTWILELVFTFASNYCQIASFFKPEEHFFGKKQWVCLALRVGGGEKFPYLISRGGACI